MLPQTLTIFSLKVPRYLPAPIICFLAPFLSDTSSCPVEATWKYICDNKDKYLPLHAALISRLA